MVGRLTLGCAAVALAACSTGGFGPLAPVDAGDESPWPDDAAADAAADAPSPPTDAPASQPDASETPDAEMPDAEARDAAPARVSAAHYSGTLPAASFSNARSAWASALDLAGDVVVAVNPDSDTISTVDAVRLARTAEIRVGREPRTVAVTPDGAFAAVTNFQDATLSIVDLAGARELFFLSTGAMPYGVVLVGARAFVTELARGTLGVYDMETRQRIAQVALEEFPAGLAACLRPRCALPEGDALLVSHLYSGRVSIVPLADLRVARVLSTGADTNASQLVALSPDGARAYLPQTRSFADNPNRQFDTTVFPVVNVVDLAAGRLLNAARVTIDTIDRPVSLPFAAELAADGKTLWIANAGSDDVSVVDVGTLRKRANIEVGAHPRALRRSPDGRRVYVNEALDGTLGVIDTTSFARVARVPLTTIPLDPVVLHGKRLFHSAARADVAKDQWMSCATCHLDGFTDKRTWRSFPDGPRNTTALFALEDTLPLHWSGDLDERHDVEATIRFVQAGTGLAPAPIVDTLGPKLAGASPDLDAMAAYIGTLRPPPSPWQDDPAAIARGQAVFGRLACASCHPPPFFTDRMRHDVGTGDPVVERNSHGHGTSYDTPSLRALWLSSPYLHDGSAARLHDVLARGPAHDVRGAVSPSELDDLVAFLRAL